MLEVGLIVTFEGSGNVTHKGPIVGFVRQGEVANVRSETDGQIWSVPVGAVTVDVEAITVAYLDAFKSMTVFSKSIEHWEAQARKGRPHAALFSCLTEFERAEALTRRIEAWADATGHELPDYETVKAHCR